MRQVYCWRWICSPKDFVIGVLVCKEMNQCLNVLGYRIIITPKEKPIKQMIHIIKEMQHSFCCILFFASNKGGFHYHPTPIPNMPIVINRIIMGAINTFEIEISIPPFNNCPNVA